MNKPISALKALSISFFLFNAANAFADDQNKVHCTVGKFMRNLKSRCESTCPRVPVTCDDVSGFAFLGEVPGGTNVGNEFFIASIYVCPDSHSRLNKKGCTLVKPKKSGQVAKKKGDTCPTLSRVPLSISGSRFEAGSNKIELGMNGLFIDCPAIKSTDPKKSYPDSCGKLYFHVDRQTWCFRLLKEPFGSCFPLEKSCPNDLLITSEKNKKTNEVTGCVYQKCPGGGEKCRAVIVQGKGDFDKENFSAVEGPRLEVQPLTNDKQIGYRAELLGKDDSLLGAMERTFQSPDGVENYDVIKPLDKSYSLDDGKERVLDGCTGEPKEKFNYSNQEPSPKADPAPAKVGEESN